MSPGLGARKPRQPLSRPRDDDSHLLFGTCPTCSPLHYRGPRPAAVPPWAVEWRGYRLPRGRAFRRAALVEVAGANGYRLSHDMLHRWRVWDFLPPPIAGGPTGHGPGKGQTWSREAGVCVAWLARWQTDALTYDVLRLALWPFRAQLATTKPGDVQRSLVAFLRQDRDFHSRAQQAYGEAWPDGLETYLDVVEPMGAPTGKGARSCGHQDWRRPIPGSRRPGH